MSALSRRACYKCGNIGHYAEVCSSAGRLCYNCKKPGHESNICPIPRSVEAKQCYYCQGFGHVQADCPTIRINGNGVANRCQTCQSDHLARTYYGPINRNVNSYSARSLRAPASWLSRGPAPFTFASRTRYTTCYKCGGPNHFARDCQALAIKCYACGKLGHISRNCTAPSGGILSSAGKTCHGCGETGHISRNCTQKTKSEPSSTDTCAAGAPAAQVASGSDVR